MMGKINKKLKPYEAKFKNISIYLGAGPRIYV
jgi:hypothetical protein